MPLIKYVDKKFQGKSRKIIDEANLIISEYWRQGFDLTLRQIYYQFVSRGIIPNSDAEYKKLGSVINDGRLSGEIGWDAIIDRTRLSRHNPHWDSPQDIIEGAAKQFRIDTRADQYYYTEVWVEKDALIGVLEQICTELDVPYFSCRGYVSQSSMWEAARRFIVEEESSHITRLIHLGDHDPSGIDMTRDIQERLRIFKSECEVQRIALTMEQIEQYNPPPNPAKITDSRCQAYTAEHGEESWELDALEPQVIIDLIKEAVGNLTDEDKREVLIEKQNDYRKEMLKLTKHWEKVTTYLALF